MSQRCCVFTNQTEYDVCRRQSPGAIKSRGDEGSKAVKRKSRQKNKGHPASCGKSHGERVRAESRGENK